jgi:hypothetical protein
VAEAKYGVRVRGLKLKAHGCARPMRAPADRASEHVPRLDFLYFHFHHGSAKCELRDRTDPGLKLGISCPPILICSWLENTWKTSATDTWKGDPFTRLSMETSGNFLYFFISGAVAFIAFGLIIISKWYLWPAINSRNPKAALTPLLQIPGRAECSRNDRIPRCNLRLFVKSRGWAHRRSAITPGKNAPPKRDQPVLSSIR